MTWFGAFVLAAQLAHPAPSTAIRCDVLAFGAGPTGVVLASPQVVDLRTAAGHDVEWRFRDFDAHAELGTTVTNPRISADGTFLAVDAPTGTQLLDLTQPDVLQQAQWPRRNTFPNGFLDPVRSLASVVSSCGISAHDADNWRSNLDEEDDEFQGIVWSFARIRLNPSLYAPVLQFATGENVYTSTFEYWNEFAPGGIINGITLKNLSTRDQIDRVHEALSHRAQRCAIYYRIRAYEGSWLIEYWFYYPLDVGAFGDHLHDTEHMFVEVDKIGGAVIQVIGAGHGDWASNNIYQAFHAHALPVRLPLFAILELRKHATAPDMNHDGVFTPGLDTNSFLDRAKTWGIRDTIGATDSNLRAYEPSMMLPRSRAFAHAVTDYNEYFAESVPQCDCQLLPLPDVARPTIGKPCQDPTTAACGEYMVLTHPDAVEPSRVLKASLYPPAFLRVGFGWAPAAITDLDAYHKHLTRKVLHVGFGAELAALTGQKLPVPGRIMFDVLLRNRLEYQYQGDTKVGTVNKGFGVGGFELRYERLQTNMFGGYFSVAYLRDLQPPDTSFATGAWLTAGIMLEMSKPYHPTPMNVSWGLTYNDYFGISTEITFSLNLRLNFRSGQFGTTNPW